jgi:class 3 adenylate cyclase/tetratricopeptide (TPR) repeat protein
MTEQERIAEIERSISALEAQRGVLGDAVVDPALAALRKELEGLKPRQVSAQRKQVTVLFADVSGFTAMSETMDAEDVHDTMNALWERLDGVIIDHGGLIDKHVGDEVMALFGAPTAHEDDPERAIRAALAMQAELAAFREERQAHRSAEGSRRGLAMRIGINTGPVLLGAVGTTDEYTAMGDAVNLASRLEGAAPVGGILVSHDTYRHVRGVFDMQVPDPIHVKGKAEPIQVYVVQSAKPRAFRVPTRGVEGIETRMVGREGELGRLQDALYTVVEDREAQVVTIVGEAGVGKSRLLYEFRNWLNLQPEGVRIFQGRATPEMANLPYSLIRDLFAFRFEIQASDPAAVAREKLEQGIVDLLGTEDLENTEKAHFIGHLIGFNFSESPHLRSVIGDAQQIHERAFLYTVQLFAAMTSFPLAGETEGGAVAIYLEDLHWADDGSLDLIDHLGRECRDMPLLILGLTRPILFERRPLWGEGQEAHSRVELRPLSKRNSRRLVREILQQVEEVPQDLRDLIVDGAEGNPFYVEELIRMLIEDRVVVKGEDRWRVEMERLAQVRVPPTLTGVVQARLDSLPQFERETLQRASVVGRIFWDGAVDYIGESAGQPAGGGDEERRQQRLALLRHILDTRFDEGELRTLCFDLGVEYEDLPAMGQANKARELVAYFERRDRIPELISTGRQMRGDVPWDDVAGTTEDTSPGADIATDLQALRERELIYGREMSAFVGTREYIFKHAILRDVTYESVLKRLRRVYHGQVAAWLTEQSGERVGEYAGLIGEHFERAEERAQASEWYGRAGRQAQETYALEAALEYYQKALAVEERWEWYKGQAEVLHILGRRDEEQSALETLGTASEAPVFDVTYLWGQYYEAIGEYPQAQVAVEKALAICRGEGDVVGQVRCLAHLGLIARRQGNLDGAKMSYDRARALFQGRETYSDVEARALAQALNGLGTVHRQQGSFDQARMCYERAWNLNRTTGDRRGEAKALDSLGTVAFHQRDFARALPYHQQALEISRTIGDRAREAESLVNLAVATRDAGDYSHAQEHLSEALAILQAIGNRWEEVNIWNDLGILYHELGELTHAGSCLERGLRVAEDIGDEEGKAYLLANLGLVMRDQGDLPAAEQLLSDGLNLWRQEGNEYQMSFFLSYLSTVSLNAGRLEDAVQRAAETLALRQELDMRLNMADDLATLAASHLASSDTPQALDYARQALAILEECGGEGPEFPQRDYFICYQVLAAAGQTERAQAALQSANDLVMARADKIADPALRQSFLERVQINHEIVQEYENVTRET